MLKAVGNIYRHNNKECWVLEKKEPNAVLVKPRKNMSPLNKVGNVVIVKNNYLLGLKWITK